MAPKKIVVVGDQGCGKTALIFSFFAEHIPDPAVPTIYKEYAAEVELEDGARVPLVIWIAPVQEHYSQIRPLSYLDTDAVLLCYSVDDPASLEHLEDKWVPEVRRHLPDAPLVLVANKADLQPAVTTDRGRALADKIRARSFVQCSAKNADNVQAVFRAAAAASTGR